MASRSSSKNSDLASEYQWPFVNNVSAGFNFRFNLDLILGLILGLAFNPVFGVNFPGLNLLTQNDAQGGGGSRRFH